MEVFLSSVIDGFEEFRAAAAQAATDLGHTVVRAEDLGASPTSPRRVCLAEARNAGAVILILGDRYGLPQPSGLSPTHEEYREAREEDKVVAFIQTGVVPEPAQQSLIDEVMEWEGGQFVSRFSTAAELRSAVTGALHRLELTREAGPADDAEVLARSMARLSGVRSYGTTLEVVVAGGPRRVVIRPGDLPGRDLAEWLTEMAVTGPTRLFPIAGSGNTAVISGVLTFSHQRGAVSVDDLATVGVVFDLSPPGDRTFRSGFTPVIHEVVEERVVTALRFVSAALEHLDPIARINKVVPVARLTGGIGAWMSRAEAEANGSGAMTLNARADAPAVFLAPSGRRRASLSADADGIARDLTARLRDVATAGRGLF